MIPEERPEAVEARLRDVMNSAALSFPGISVKVRRVLLAEPFKPLPGVDHLVQPLARHASDIFGIRVSTHGIPLYTDARHYAAAGIPTVLYGAGPRSLLEANAHRADECLVLDDLWKVTEVVARTLADLLESGESPCRERS